MSVGHFQLYGALSTGTSTTTETSVTASDTPVTWVELTKTVTPTITGAIEVILKFPSGPLIYGGNYWYDDFTVVENV
jgi:hypothetical protein